MNCNILTVAVIHLSFAIFSQLNSSPANSQHFCDKKIRDVSVVVAVFHRKPLTLDENDDGRVLCVCVCISVIVHQYVQTGASAFRPGVRSVGAPPPHTQMTNGLQ